jgi:GT2 family glycosyltransferase
MARESVQYVMLLNPDTVVRPGAIEALADFLDENAHIGVVGSQLEDEEGRLVNSGRRRPSALSELSDSASLGALDRLLTRHLVPLAHPDRPIKCDWVSGAAMMIRRRVLEQIGLLDSGYFLYFEELDFCDRARQGGWEVWLVPSSRVVHLEGSATGISRTNLRRPSYWYDSRRRYFLRQHGLVTLIVADVARMVGRISFLLRRQLRLGGDRGGDPRYFMWDLVSGDLRALLSGQAWAILKEPLES